MMEDQQPLATQPSDPALAAADADLLAPLAGMNDPNEWFQEAISERARIGDAAARREAFRLIASLLEGGQIPSPSLRVVGADLLRAIADAAEAMSVAPNPHLDDTRERKEAERRLRDAAGAPVQRSPGRRRAPYPAKFRQVGTDAIASTHEVLRRDIGSRQADERIASLLGVDERTVERYRQGYNALKDWSLDDLELMAAALLKDIRDPR